MNKQVEHTKFTTRHHGSVARESDRWSPQALRENGKRFGRREK